MNNFPASPRMTVLSCMIAVGMAALAAPAPAAANVYRDVSAGGACQAAVGSTTNFQYANHYLTNIGTTDRYVVCHLPTSDPAPGNPGAAITFLNVHFTAGATGGTAVCVAQTGSHYAGANQISGTRTQSVAVAPGMSGYIPFDTTYLVRNTVYNTVTMNCKVPAGWKMGLIEYWTSV